MWTLLLVVHSWHVATKPLWWWWGWAHWIVFMTSLYMYYALSLVLVACLYMLNTFPGPGYLCSKDSLVWSWHFLVNFHVYGSPLYPATAQPQWLMTIWRDSGLRTLFHSWEFGGQQRVLKTFIGSRFLCSEDGVVWPAFLDKFSYICR